MSHGIISLGT